MLRERVGMLQQIEPYLGTFYSREWAQKNVLMLTDDDIKMMNDQIDQEKKDGEIPDQDQEPDI